MTNLMITRPTVFKKKPLQSFQLPNTEKVDVCVGNILKLNSFERQGEHYFVSLQEEINPVGKEGYFYVQHVVCPSGEGGFAQYLVKIANEEWYSIKQEAINIVGGEANTCVGFTSEAIRRVAQEQGRPEFRVPRDTVWTVALREFLADRCCTKIFDPQLLMPGDICFSNDEPGYPGEPAHVYIFMECCDGEMAYGEVIDNNGQKHPRNIKASGPRTPFHYAYRIT
jgi:hypothetical protein